MTSCQSVTNGRLLCVVTGASRGIGAAIATTLARVAGDGSSFVITARTVDGMTETETRIKEINANLLVIKLAMDMDTYNSAIDSVSMQAAIGAAAAVDRPIDVVVVVHNAGTLGDLSMRSADANAEWSKHLKTNLLSMIELNAAIVEALAGKAATKFCINISSLLAVKGMPSFVQYCTSRAARDGYMRCFAVEHEDEWRCVSYAPGPIQTAMTSIIIDTSCDTSTADAFRKMRDEGALLTPEFTASKLLALLDANKFTSGEHIDVYDV